MEANELKAWREAWQNGGFPMPRLDRWQVLRAGVVNLWEFEAVEYWFADGWAQLFGANETGKSTLMALTTLIPLLGDTSPDKIDTLGRSGKQFGYYVRPTHEGSDRRTSDLSFYHGWLWVEYGRVVDGQPHFFTTLLYTYWREGNTRFHARWCTCEDSRVRGDLAIFSGRTVNAAKEITAPGWQVHDNATSYRKTVARKLFSCDWEKLEAIGRILKVTRTPKLGAQLESKFVTDKLREALPALETTEITKLAQGWDALDGIRKDLDTTKKALGDVKDFIKTHWWPWTKAVLRIAADEAAQSRSELDKVTRNENDSRAKLAENRERKEALDSALEEVRAQLDQARTQHETLRNSAAYRDAESRAAQVRSLRELVRVDTAQHERDSADVERCRQREGHDSGEVNERTANLDQAQRRVVDAKDTAVSTFRAAGYTGETSVDIVWLRQWHDEREGELRQARTLLKVVEQATQQAVLLENTAGDALARAEKSKRSAEESWNRVEEEYQRLSSSVTEWASSVDADGAGAKLSEAQNSEAKQAGAKLTEAWLSQLPTSYPCPAGTLTEAIRRDWYQPRKNEIQARTERELGEIRRLCDQVTQIDTEVAALESTGVQAPLAPQLWRRRSRHGAPGAALWQLLNPRAGIAPADLAHIEAALAAAGLLDAWVAENGIYDDADTFLAPLPASTASRTLADALETGESAGVLGRQADNLLAGVALVPAGAAMPAQGLAISVDGRWQAAGLAGTALPVREVAEWLGEEARAAQRRRRLAELATQKDQLLADIASHTGQVEELERRGAELDAQYAQAPSDMTLRNLLTAWNKDDERARADEAEAAAKQKEAEEARTRCDNHQAELAQYAAEHAVPKDRDGLDNLREHLQRGLRHLDAWRQALLAEESARGELEKAQRRLEEARANLEQARQRLAETARSLAAHSEELRVLEETANQSDVAILEQVEECAARITRLEAEREQAQKQHSEALVNLERASNELERVTEERERALANRDTCYAAFRELIDAGLARRIQLELPESESSAITNVREQVATVRREVTVRGWKDSPEQRADNYATRDKLRRKAEDAIRDLRAKLEDGGRTVTARVDRPLLEIDIRIDSNGQSVSIDESIVRLGKAVDDIATTYGMRERETLDELLGSTFLEYLREQIGEAEEIVAGINTVLAKHPTGTDKTTLRVKLQPGANADLLNAVTGSTLFKKEVQDQVRAALKNKIDEAKRSAQDQALNDWTDELARRLDYRTWYEINLERRFDKGNWGPLTTRSYSELSGGARAVMLMAPLISTLAALYLKTENSPRPIWFDEAFDGLDDTNKGVMMSMLRDFDLDVLLVGPGRLVNIKEVPAAAIYQVVRAPAPLEGADVTLELWAGNTLESIELPCSWVDDAGPSPAGEPEAEGMLL